MYSVSMPTQIPFFDSETRSLWVTPGSVTTTLQVQDGAWFSDRFRAPTSRLEALAVGFRS